MDVMDPLTFEHLSGPPLPGFFGVFSPFSGSAAAQQTETTDTELDAYVRVIGVLPPVPPVRHAAAFEVSWPVELPSMCELYASARDAYVVQPAVEVPVAPSLSWFHERSVPVISDVSASKNSAARARLSESDHDADIDFNLREMEKDAKERPSPDYLKTVQGDRMCPSTRANLVLWMDAFVRFYDLAPGTLHRAVAYVDRVLSVRTLTTHGDYALRLLGATAAFTGAKYEDQRTRLKLNAVEIARYCGLATSEAVLDMERNMVAALEYQLGGPTAYTFVDHFTRYSQGEQELQVQWLAHQLADASLLDYGCLDLMPSAVAASAVFLARLALNTPPAGLVRQWNKDFQKMTGYKPMELVHGIGSLYEIILDPRFIIFPEFLQDP